MPVCKSGIDQKNKETLVSFIESVWNNGDVHAVDAFLADTYPSTMTPVIRGTSKHCQLMTSRNMSGSHAHLSLTRNCISRL